MNATSSRSTKEEVKSKNSRRKVMNAIRFSDLLKNQEKDQLIANDAHDILEEKSVENQKLLVKVFDSEGIYELMNEFIMNENRSFEEEPIFNKTRYVSNDSHNDFYQKYKHFNVNKRKGQAKENTPSFAFIRAVNDQMLVPNPLGMIKKKGKENEINLKNQQIGDEYMKALSKGLKYSDHINELNLSHNRLTFHGVNSLINSVQENKNLLKKLKVIDLSYNKIGPDSIEKLIKYIQQEECELKELNLEGNSLGDKIIINLSEYLVKHLADKLYSLNYGKNLISDESAISLANILQYCHNLQNFVLCWNHLKNYGASLIINKLRKHYQMKVFDISWNSIGNSLNLEPTVDEIQKVTKPGRSFYNHEMNEFRRTMNVQFKKYANNNVIPTQANVDVKNSNKEKLSTKNLIRINKEIIIPKNISAFAKELGEYFKETVIDLVHLDISHNNIPYDDCLHLATCIKSNHTILGIHVDGNEMSVDSLGFIHPMIKLQKNPDYYANSQIYYGISKENNLIKSNVDKVRKIRAKNNCWICEGWTERDIKYYPKDKVDNPALHHVKLHLNFDEWKPYDTIYSNSSFFNSRMCPPGEVQYFFSFDKKIIENYGNHTIKLKESVLYEFDDEYNKEIQNLQMMNEYHNTTESIKNNEDQKFNDTDFKNHINVFTVDKVGSFHVEVNRNVIDEYYRKNLKYCEPRPEKSFNKFIKPRTPWSYAVSIWAYYDYKFEGDTEEYINSVFEFDFSRCYGEEKKELKPLLRPHYRKIIDGYKLLSSQMGSAVWQINQTALTDFVNNCPGLLDSTYVINDVFVKEREVKAADKMEKSKNKLKTLPDNIIRHQLLNMLVKLASDKYVRTKIYDLTEAVNFSVTNHYEPFFRNFDNHTWRKERYYNEPIDNFFKSHMPILDAVFKSWAIKEPGKKDQWMILDGFTDLMLRLVDTESFPVRELPMYFNISMKLQIDEISTERIFKMQFYEFLESLSRVIDKAYPASPQGDKSIPLISKLESIVPTLIKSITNPEFKLVREKFPLPTKEQGTGLYEYDYSNPFYQGNEIIVKKK